MTKSRHAEWLTTPQVCMYLGITAEEWDEVRADHLERWLDSLPLASPEEFFAAVEACFDEHDASANDRRDDNTDTSRRIWADASAVSIRVRDGRL